MDKADEVYEHYSDTMGEVPPSLRVLADEAKQAFEGYTRMRQWALRPDARGGLSLGVRHLMLSVLDCAGHNLTGAENHARAAMRNGVSADQVRDAMVLLIIVCGMPTWGGYGRHVVAMAREEERGLTTEGT